jgi:hypothetical protein
VRGLTATKTEEFSVALSLRYYDLTGGALNVAVPAQADAVGPNPISAARQAVRAAWGKLLKRLEAQNRIPVRAPAGGQAAAVGRGGVSTRSERGFRDK